MKRWGKSPPLSRVTEEARKTQSSARQNRGSGGPSNDLGYVAPCLGKDEIMEVPLFHR